MKILALDRYYYPDWQASACILTDISEHLTLHHQVTVLCGFPSSCPDGVAAKKAYQRHECIKGVSVVRIGSLNLPKRNLLLRSISYASFFFGVFCSLLLRPRHDLTIVMTSPPLIGILAFAMLIVRGIPYVYICQDIFPDTLVQGGIVRRSFLTDVFSWMNVMVMRRAISVVAISHLMAQRLSKRRIPQEKIVVIENWTDSAVVTCVPKNNAFSRMHGLTDKFVIMYAGNMGFSHPVEDLILALKELSDYQDIVALVVGAGALQGKLQDLVFQLGIKNVRFLPVQRKERLSEVLASADVLTVLQKKGLAGFTLPSRIYSYFPAGKAIVAVVEAESEIADMLRAADCGCVVSPGNHFALTQTIEKLYQDQNLLKRYADNALSFARRKNFKISSLKKYDELITTLENNTLH